MTDQTSTSGRAGDRPGLGARFRSLPPIERVLVRLGRRAPIDDAHAPGHRHLKPPPAEQEIRTGQAEPRRNQPWIRTTHSDSQKRRPRR